MSPDREDGSDAKHAEATAETRPVPPSDQPGAEADRVEGARRIGSKLDRSVKALAEMPGWVYLLALIAFGAAAFPYSMPARDGFIDRIFDSTVMLLTARLAVLVGLLAIIYFLLRSIVWLVESGRFLTSAAGASVDSETAGEAAGQLDSDAQELEAAKAEITGLKQRLKEADENQQRLMEQLERYAERHGDLEEETGSVGAKNPEE